jgi:hypothetical protein
MGEPRFKVLKFYTYRSGRIGGDSILIFPIEPMREFQKFLAKESGVNYCDNHTCFLTEMEDPMGRKKIVAFMFSDHIMYMGDRIEEKSW